MTGIDEAGRGSLAGPVVVASLTWRPDRVHRKPWFSACADSKMLDSPTRERLLPHLLAAADRVRIAVIHQVVIDALNILRATLHGFELVAPPFHSAIPLIIDGNQKPPSLKWAKTQVKGDRHVSAVAAAGIVAKQVRDRLLTEADQHYPGYGLAGHKGYATVKHRRAIGELGPSAFHRKSFRPVKDFFTGESDHEKALSWSQLSTGLNPSDAWQAFCQNYHRLSPAEDRLAINWLNDRGFILLPSPEETQVRLSSECRVTQNQADSSVSWQALPLFSS